MKGGTSSFKFEEVKRDLLDFLVRELYHDLEFSVVLYTSCHCQGFPECAVLAMSTEGIFADGGTCDNFVGHRS